MKERDVPILNSDHVYRYSRARAIIAYAAIVGAFAALFVNGLRHHAWPLEAIAGFGIFCMVLARRFLTARFRASNWLVRETENGLYIHFRSYLNYHFAADDLTVAFLPYREISHARRVREKLVKPNLGHPGQMTTQSIHIAELDLTCDASALAAQVAAERGRSAPNERTWYGKTSVKYQDYPVSLNGATVRIVWQCVPSIRAFIGALGRRHVAVVDVDQSRPYAVNAA